MYKKIIQAVVLSLLGLWGCSSRETRPLDNYKGMSVQLVTVSKRDFSTGSIVYGIKIGDYKAVMLDAYSTDLYDRPYSDDIFGNRPRAYVDTNTGAYLNTINYDRDVNPTMLYINPEKYSRETFDIYADFFVHQWMAEEKKINKDFSYIENHIIGIVYGAREDFIKRFYGSNDGVNYVFTISADGVIDYSRDEEPLNYERSGLAQKVEMPGKIIRIEDTLSLTVEKLKRYKDKAGKTMDAYFTIVSTTE